MNDKAIADLQRQIADAETRSIVLIASREEVFSANVERRQSSIRQFAEINAELGELRDRTASLEAILAEFLRTPAHRRSERH
jgi:hypothetical protein